MPAKYLICTDLDRTLLPNGQEPESPGARAVFTALVNRPEITLAYVSGRSLGLVREAMKDYELPQPDYIVGDVGTSIFRPEESGWQRWQAWDEEIAPDWRGVSGSELASLLADFEVLREQEADKQSRFKLSYYAPIDLDEKPLLTEMQARLERVQISASLVWSVDEQAGMGLLDVLPASATKRHAVEFLQRVLNFDLASTVFAGDSGNDLPVLVSPIQSILVANASAQLKQEALENARANGLVEALYIAHGDWRGMNGNYAAGIVEGMIHYLTPARSWLEEVA